MVNMSTVIKDFHSRNAFCYCLSTYVSLCIAFYHNDQNDQMPKQFV